jgi:hypothetical protein
MFTVTINGNSTSELINNMETLLANLKGANAQAFAASPARVAPPALPHVAPMAMPPVNPIEATVPSAPPSLTGAPVATTPIANTVPTMAQGAMPAPSAPAAPALGGNAAAPVTQPPPPAAGLPPHAPAPTYTLDQLAKAGAALASSGKMEDALALLAKYGVQTVNQLAPEQYGAFATELRALGAQV